ncbi:DUF3564 family protein [Burkholderia gladioli]|uniref:DUF3564 family protein n=1 Tax=Burkholderia gladioli TaxID=28095 RepID=UPI0015E79092|nr:DUF3564 family protein [Burkholderia gladioli]MBA1363252.1 DUF3564 family protein [Burkholderia gladioli]
MRITLHLDSFAHTRASDYAIVWIDTATRRWSREGQAGIELPAWGTLACENGGVRMMAQDKGSTHCSLEDLDLAAGSGPLEGQSGCAYWQPGGCREPVPGSWRVQCIDLSSTPPEHEVFTGQED